MNISHFWCFCENYQKFRYIQDDEKLEQISKYRNRENASETFKLIMSSFTMTQGIDGRHGLLSKGF
jgi:hypothetical protein